MLLHFKSQEPTEAYVYILTNDNNTVLYTGFTDTLAKRIYLHKRRLLKGFTKKYNCHRLIYWEYFPDVKAARLRERQIKGKTRDKKIALINIANPLWNELPVVLCEHSGL